MHEDASYFNLYWKRRFKPASYRRRINSLRLNYGRFLPDSAARVVDVGPGFGEMLELLRERGIADPQAIDIDPHVVEALRQRGFVGAVAEADTIGHFVARPGGYDSVIALHVLEHFAPDDGRRLLEAIHTSLAPGGRVILEVPNMANFITAPYARWADYTHRTGFTQESLSATLLGAGFARIETFGIARPVRSLAEAVAWAGQSLTSALAWVLLKANYPQARIVTAPALAAIGWKTGPTA